MLISTYTLRGAGTVALGVLGAGGIGYLAGRYTDGPAPPAASAAVMRAWCYDQATGQCVRSSPIFGETGCAAGWTPGPVDECPSPPATPTPGITPTPTPGPGPTPLPSDRVFLDTMAVGEQWPWGPNGVVSGECRSTGFEPSLPTPPRGRACVQFPQGAYLTGYTFELGPKVCKHEILAWLVMSADGKMPGISAASARVEALVASANASRAVSAAESLELWKGAWRSEVARAATLEHRRFRMIVPFHSETFVRRHTLEKEWDYPRVLRIPPGWYVFPIILGTGDPHPAVVEAQIGLEWEGEDVPWVSPVP